MKKIHLYFTTATDTADGEHIVFLSELDGRYVLKSRKTDGNEITISKPKGILRSYVFPYGGKTGISLVSPVLDAHRSKIIWIEDSLVKVFCLKRNCIIFSSEDVLKGWVPGYGHISPCGKHYIFPCTDPRAFNVNDKSQHTQLYEVPRRLFNNGFKTKIIRVDLYTGKIITLAYTDIWVTHVQYSPSGKYILCNSEGTSFKDAAPEAWKRLWLLKEDDKKLVPIPNQKRKVRVNHENFVKKSNDELILYHGYKRKKGKFFLYQLLRIATRFKFSRWRDFLHHKVLYHFVEIIDLDGSVVDYFETTYEISHAISVNRYEFVYDSKDGYIVKVNLKNRSESILCMHGSSFSDQLSHPHPNPSTNSRSIYYCSDELGFENIYQVSL